MSKGILICGHGSRKGKSNIAFKRIVDKIANKYSDYLVAEGFLEYQTPSIEAGLNKLEKAGVSEIILVPVFLFTGIHIKKDIPSIVSTFRAKYPNIKVFVSSYIGPGSELVTLCEKRISETESNLKAIPRAETALLLIGVGSSEQEANDQITDLSSKVSLISEVGYMQHAFISSHVNPNPVEVLHEMMKLTYSRIVILPVLLFDGIYLNQIKSLVKKIETTTSKELVIAKVFNDDECVLQALLNRIEKANSA